MAHHCRPIRLALAVATAICMGQLQAAEWVAEPSIDLRGEFNDNYRLTNIAHNNVWIATLDPRLKLSRRSELWDLNASGRVRASHFYGEDGLDTTDSFFNLAAKRTLERGSWDIAAAQTNDTTLQNEVLDQDTGLTVNQIDRTQRNFTVTGSYMFNEDTWIEASAGYSRIEYNNGEQYGLLNYDYTTPSLRVIHELNPRTQTFLIYSRSTVNYDTSSSLKSVTDSLQFGTSYDITETWKINGSIGGRRTKTSQYVMSATVRPGFELLYPSVYDVVYLPRDSQTTGLVYNASISREFETGSLSLSGSQSITPSSTGTDTESTSITLTGSHNFSAKLLTALAVSYYQSSTVGNTATRADNTRYRVAPNLTWKLDRDLALNAGYTYTRVKRAAASNSTVASNAVYVSLGYSWPRMAISR